MLATRRDIFADNATLLFVVRVQRQECVKLRFIGVCPTAGSLARRCVYCEVGVLSNDKDRRRLIGDVLQGRSRALRIIEKGCVEAKYRPYVLVNQRQLGGQWMKWGISVTRLATLQRELDPPSPAWTENRRVTAKSLFDTPFNSNTMTNEITLPAPAE